MRAAKMKSRSVGVRCVVEDSLLCCLACLPLQRLRMLTSYVFDLTRSQTITSYSKGTRFLTTGLKIMMERGVTV